MPRGTQRVGGTGLNRIQTSHLCESMSLRGSTHRRHDKCNGKVSTVNHRRIRFIFELCFTDVIFAVWAKDELRNTSDMGTKKLYRRERRCARTSHRSRGHSQELSFL